jgi:ankyrin repeat protein
MYESFDKACRTMKQDLVQELYAWPGLDTHDKWHALIIIMVSLEHVNVSALSRFPSIQLRALLENVAEANLMIDSLIDRLAYCRAGSRHRPILEVLVEVELTSHAASHERRSAMVSACVQGHGALVCDLLDEGYRIDLMDGASYFDALSGASRNGHADALEVFLAHDPDIELQEADSYREVIQAVTMGRFDNVLKLLLDRSRGFRAQDRAIYRGPLRQAAQLGFHDIVQILRERGVTLPEDGATGLELPTSVA